MKIEIIVKRTTGNRAILMEGQREINYENEEKFLSDIRSAFNMAVLDCPKSCLLRGTKHRHEWKNIAVAEAVRK